MLLLFGLLKAGSGRCELALSELGFVGLAGVMRKSNFELRYLLNSGKRNVNPFESSHCDKHISGQIPINPISPSNLSSDYC